ncbi:e9imm peptide [Streptomyces sp. C10-9-1]|uniref:e9imm peptide n=1 Tax=Streptomyces sp. C10-9-1 TaxID=1859285 RepID=UPI00211273F1|nr:e9imm peptide [Streptomyces sp. C10-9-1]MCQ6553185.1 e9imm peptide [Streptomyces sp. C10-9-1]
MARAATVALVQKIMNADYADDAEAYGALEALGRALGCPTGYVSDLIFWPKGRELTAAEVVDQALEYRPFAL